MKEWHVRHSRVVRQWRKGRAATCFRINLHDPLSAELASLSGVDCIWVDMEHCAPNWQTVEAHIARAKINDVDTLVRVAGSSAYSDFIRPLEMDAAGLMIPHVDSALQAKNIVQTVKFQPLGMRPLDGGNADAKYRLVPLETYLREANEERFTIAMIESPQGMDALEPICETPGIDALLFGPVDFAQAAGFAGHPDAIEVLRAKERVANVARRHGKHIVGGAHISEYKALVDMGYDFIVVGTDIAVYTDYCQTVAACLSTGGNIDV